MIVGLFFLSARLVELLFLIPIVGMLSYLVHIYVTNNALTPTYILVLFIVSTIAAVWALFTAIFYGSAKHNGYFLWFVDLCIFGGLIAGVYELGPIGSLDCNSDTFATRSNALYIMSGALANDFFPKNCGLLKASFALGIIEIILFFWTSLLALWVHHHHKKDLEKDRRQTTERHYSRHSNRRSGSSRSGSRSRAGAADDYYNDRRRATSRSGSQYRRTSSYV